MNTIYLRNSDRPGFRVVDIADQPVIGHCVPGFENYIAVRHTLGTTQPGGAPAEYWECKVDAAARSI